jgi:predicted O-methyltransferase YrrM
MQVAKESNSLHYQLCRFQEMRCTVMPTTFSLFTPPIADTLTRLHLAARSDWKHRVAVAPRYILSRLSGHDFMGRSDRALNRTYASVTRQEGRFLYVLAHARKPRQIVEFGCSYGISTLYLAAAARDCGGRLVTTEINPAKVAGTRESLNAAGLADTVTILEGDALQRLLGFQSAIDLLFLDGAKHLYLPVLELLRSQLSDEAIVVADNVDMPSARKYVEHVRAPSSGFASSTLFGGRMEVSCLAQFAQRH